MAREINRLVREEGIRYRQIAVVTGSVGQYGEHVEDVFEKYNIPYFMDETKGILFNHFIITLSLLILLLLCCVDVIYCLSCLFDRVMLC